MNAPLCLTDILGTNAIVGEPKAGARRFWTGAEEKKLREHYPKVGLEGCVPLLPGRSTSAIYNRVGALGLRAPNQPKGMRQRWASSPQIDAIITRVYQREPRKSAINDLARSVGRPRWWIHRRDIRSFVVNNVASVDFRKVDKFWLVDLLTGAE